MKFLNNCHLRLCEFASKDEKRPSLNWICFHEKLQKVVSSDGMRLYATTEFYNGEWGGREERCYSAKSFEHLDFADKAHSSEYVDVLSVLPSGEKIKQIYNWDVPLWLSDLKRSANHTIWAGIENEYLFLNKKCDIQFNLRLFMPFAGESVCLAWAGNSGIIVCSQDDRQFLKEESFYSKCKWFSVVMPLRGVPGNSITCFWRQDMTVLVELNNCK